MFLRVKAPSNTDLEAVLQQISTRLTPMLGKEGVLAQNMENSTLDHLETNPMQQLQGRSITYRMKEGCRKICAVIWPSQRCQNSGWP